MNPTAPAQRLDEETPEVKWETLLNKLIDAGFDCGAYDSQENSHAGYQVLLASLAEAKRNLTSHANAAIQEATHYLKISQAVLEDVKLALDMPGTGSYVEWARECRKAITERDQLRADLAAAYEREKVLREGAMRDAALRTVAADMVGALEAAPEPVCLDSMAGLPYEAPHIVKNFAAVDRWWIRERNAALSAYTALNAQKETKI